MKVLLMAYECSPYHGSEWGVGWGRLLQAARVAETHVITNARNYNDLLRARKTGLLPENVHVYTPELDAKLQSLLRRVAPGHPVPLGTFRWNAEFPPAHASASAGASGGL